MVRVEFGKAHCRSKRTGTSTNKERQSRYDPLDTAGPFPSGIPPFAGSLTTHTHFTDNIVRVGLNYQFH
jgi:hypothetical protein